MKKCPRRGYVRMERKGGDRGEFWAETSCKTWGCAVCRRKLKSLVEMKMEYGCSTLGFCHFITLTLKMEDERIHDARSVAKAFRVWRDLLKLRYPKLAWFKVTELTKNKKPHLHLLIGGISPRMERCRRKGESRRKWHERKCSGREKGKDCLEHEIGRLWEYVTETSFIVDVKMIYNPKGMAGYLGKYLVKAFNQREDLKELGFERRYSYSQNWPTGGKLQTAGTIAKQWHAVHFVQRTEIEPSHANKLIEAGVDHWLMRRSGDDLRLLLAKRNELKGRRSNIERLQNVLASVP